MKNSLIAIVGSLVLAGTFAVLGVAQHRRPLTTTPPAKVNLKCTPNFNSDVSTQVYVENNTGAPLAAGTVITWKTNANIVGSIKLAQALQPNKTISGMQNVPSGTSSCEAFYLK